VNHDGATPTIVNSEPFSRRVRPTMSERPPNSRCHVPKLRTVTGLSPGARSSAAVNTRPSAGVTRSVEKKSPLTSRPMVTLGCSSRPSARPKAAFCDAASPANDCPPRWTSSTSAHDKRPTGLLCVTDVRRTTRLVPGTGSGRSRKASIRLKIDAVAPTPSAVDSSTAKENPLWRRIRRSA